MAPTPQQAANTKAGTIIQADDGKSRPATPKARKAQANVARIIPNSRISSEDLMFPPHIFEWNICFECSSPQQWLWQSLMES